MHLRTIGVVLAGCFALGCAGNIDLHRYDNPQLRNLQERETRRHRLAQPQWSELVGYIGKRVVMIAPEAVAGESVNDSLMQSGRGAALTEDGYFLTAHHVVEDGPFMWSRLVGVDQLQPGRSYTAEERAALLREESHSGRLVWSDPALDLAIVKFEVNGLRRFANLTNDIPIAEVVYTADDSGSSVVRRGGRHAERIGNGSFEAAGSILDRVESRGEIGGVRLWTSLVARGGMSGSPLATEEGKVCGILTGAERDRWGRIRTVGSMVAADAIRAIIAEDRRKSMALPK